MTKNEINQQSFTAPRPVGEQAGFVNQRGDYTYLKEGYYLSQDALFEPGATYPTPREALDAYVVPVAIFKAQRAGISTPDCFLSNEYIPVPALMYAVNPYMRRHALVLKERSSRAIAKSLTRNFKYVMLGQKWPEGATLREFNLILDHTPTVDFAGLAKKLWTVFHLPIARVRVIVVPGRETLLSAILPLPLYRLKRKELQLLHRAEQWQI